MTAWLLAGVVVGIIWTILYPPGDRTTRPYRRPDEDDF